MVQLGFYCWHQGGERKWCWTTQGSGVAWWYVLHVCHWSLHQETSMFQCQSMFTILSTKKKSLFTVLRITMDFNNQVDVASTDLKLFREKTSRRSVVLTRVCSWVKLSMRTKPGREIPNIHFISRKKKSHQQLFDMPPIEHANFTTTCSGIIVCQRCKVSYPEGTKLHFLHDVTGEGPGKNVCGGCCQYYVTKTQIAGGQPTAGQLLINWIVSLHWQIPGQPSYLRQVTLGHQLTTAGQQSIQKAVAAAQREGRHCCWYLARSWNPQCCKGQSHPVRMGAHVKHTVTLTPASRVAGGVSWPTHPSASKPTNMNHLGRQGTQAVVVPDFMSKPYVPVKYRYQEVHALYDEMRKWFAKRATLTYQNEVATIKVTLMSMKPNNRNLQMVMVHKDDMAISLNAE